jgi:FkbH-like protein
MKLIDALELLKKPVAKGARSFHVILACGFTPLHFQTFLAAELQERLPGRRVLIETGLFGDLAGNIERLQTIAADAFAVLIEWSDLDPRLGIRGLGGWRPSSLEDIARSTERSVLRLQHALGCAAQRLPTVVCMPTLPFPPLFWTAPDQAGSIELQLHKVAAALAATLTEEPGIRIANMQLLDEVSPLSGRYDVKSDVVAGFPYRLPHASAVASLMSGMIERTQPKRGLITDLDDTLWEGILGEVDVDGISWNMESHTHMHGLYQQFVASLAGAGVLVAVASKNDSALVDRAFARSDLLLPRSDIFPIEAHWSRKSESVRRILDTWNVNADSVVFVDDSPMEVAEVKEAFPDVECIVFPKGDYQGIFDLLKRLRALFGKSFLTEDDALRLKSIRNSGNWRDSGEPESGSSDDLLRTAEASIVFSQTRQGEDAREFELVNKTNQFNLNGRRFGEQEWRSFKSDSGAFVLSVSYKDKFGPLGTIALMLGRAEGRVIHLSAWVMSCRAFSRRIEYQCLKHLFETFGADEIAFDYCETPRNGPLREFFVQSFETVPIPSFRLTNEQFSSKVPPLYHFVEVKCSV